jgi:hypothetical protein
MNKKWRKLMKNKFWHSPNTLQWMVLFVCGIATLRQWLVIGRNINIDEWVGGLYGVGIDLVFCFALFLVYLTISYFVSSDTLPEDSK